MSKNKIIFRNILIQNNIKISNVLFNRFISNNLKEEAYLVYKNLSLQDIEFVSFFSEKYPLELKGMLNAPLIIFTYGNSKYIKIKNVYLYASSKQDIKNNRRLLDIYNCLINNKKINIINNKNSNVKILKDDIFNKEYQLSTNIKNTCFNYILPKNCNYIYELICSMIDVLIILNAKYELDIVTMTDIAIDMGKQIYVVPGSIDDKNYMFSNYLIKDGAIVILNNKDIENI